MTGYANYAKIMTKRFGYAMLRILPFLSYSYTPSPPTPQPLLFYLSITYQKIPCKKKKGLSKYPVQK